MKKSKWFVIGGGCFACVLGFGLVTQASAEVLPTIAAQRVEMFEVEVPTNTVVTKEETTLVENIASEDVVNCPYGYENCNGQHANGECPYGNEPGSGPQDGTGYHHGQNMHEQGNHRGNGHQGGNYHRNNN